MTCGIYCITNLINGKQYVGQSIHIEQRFKEHCTREELIVDKAIKKYGKSNFEFKILEKCPINLDILNEKEIYWIEKLGTFANPSHYNFTKGGNNGEHRIGNIVSNNTRIKISKRNKGEKNGRFVEIPTITKNGFNNGKQVYLLKYRGKKIATSQSISKLEYIRDYEDWDNLNTPKVSLIRDGTVQGMQKYSVMYKKVCLKTTCDENKAQKFFKLAKSKLEGEDREYYKQNLDKVIPCRKYVHKNPSDLNNIEYKQSGFKPHKDYKLDMSKKLTSSGVYRVSLEKERFRYIYKDVLGKKRSLCSIDANKLKEKVLSLNLEWIIIDEEKAKANGLV